MRVIKVHKIVSGPLYPDLSELSDLLGKSGKGHKIDSVNWTGYSNKPEVNFHMGYSVKELFIKYDVKESCVKAEKDLSNQPVYEDSCVEFFISPDKDGLYYNFEFNSIGTCLMGIGSGRENRIQVNSNVISKIRRFPTMGTMPFKEKTGDFSWSLTIAIPFEVFFLHDVKDLKDKSLKANLYKCGDKLSAPHYLTWNEVKTMKPDFHQPSFFGIVSFV